MLYTDFVQTLIMLGGYVALVVVGVQEVGSMGEVWRAAQRGGRFNFS